MSTYNNNDDRLTRIETKIDGLVKDVNDIRLNMTEKIADVDSRVKVLEAWKNDREQNPRMTYYKWSLVATWISIGIALVAVILK